MGTKPSYEASALTIELPSRLSEVGMIKVIYESLPFPLFHLAMAHALELGYLAT